MTGKYMQYLSFFNMIFENNIMHQKHDIILSMFIPAFIYITRANTKISIRLYSKLG